MKKLLPSTSSSEGGSITLVSRACSRRMDPRGARMTAKTVLLVFAFALTFLFVACGDDSSSVFPDAVGDLPSNSAKSDDAPDSSGDFPSSSSIAESSSERSGGDPSSSSVTSSSSGTSAGSSAGNSSSSKAEDLSCTPEEEGQTFEFTLTGKKYICKNGSLIEIASSSSAAPTSSYFDMTEQFNEKVSYGEFTDPRDGQKYRTVSKYDDVFEKTYVFFAENLNYGKMVSGGTVQGDSTKYCYDNDPWYCENGWGGLYTWSNAMNFPAVCDSVSMSAEACSQKFVYPSGYTQPQYYVQHQGICPEGWHVASEGEWAYLQHSSVFDLGSKVAGFGNNGSGLSILPAGSWERYPNGSLVFRDIKKQAIFWTPQQSADDAERAHRVAIDSQGMSRIYEEVKAKRALSIRCVKNY